MTIEMNGEICAIIVTYNIGEAVSKCFESVKGQVDEIILVDNASDDDTMHVLQALSVQPNVRLFFNRENLGIAGALNIGVRYALDRGYKWILTLDHDSVPAPGMVDTMLAGYEDFLLSNHGMNIGIIAPVLYDVNSNTYLPKGYEKFHKLELVRAVISSGSLINRKVFADIGNFDEGMFLYYVDDDYCIRARKAGYSILLVADAILNHAEGNKSVKNLLGRKVYYCDYSPVANYYIFRNSIRIMRKHKLYDPHMFNHSARRIPADLFKILLYSRNKKQDVQYAVLGIIHGLTGRSGRLN
jgi:rhamnosyltransferase